MYEMLDALFGGSRWNQQSRRKKIFWKLGPVLSLSVIFLGSIDERPYHLHKYRKIPKISLSKYKPPGGLYLENSPQIFIKTKQKW